MNLTIHPKPPYNFPLTLYYLSRSDLEIVDRVRDGVFETLIPYKDRLFYASVQNSGSVHNPILQVHIESTDTDPVNENTLDYIGKHLETRFHLQDDVEEFYRIMQGDLKIQPLLTQFFGLKPVRAASLFESLSWAIIGQQINIRFAYSLKKTLVEMAGGQFVRGEVPYYSFPDARAIAALEYTDLTQKQFSRRKAEYLIDFARKVVEGSVSLNLEPVTDPVQVTEYLTRIRGIGRWTAEYALMRGLGYPDALPAADIGLRNAVKEVYGMEKQPDEETVRQIGNRWVGWRSWVAFYLWFSLAYRRQQPIQEDNV
jgi:DNA-3-methyladenine glycosylase II